MKIDINCRKISQITYFILVLAFYIYNTSLPLTLIPIAGHDDGLYMKLATSISRANWLGDFSQFTLMKGAGFPIILAILYWFKIPITIFYSLLIIGVCEYLRRVLNRLLNSYYFAGFISIILMWYPGMDPTRILREPLMSWLVILSIAMAMSFYVKFEKDNYFDRKLILLTGLVLGWICIVREEWATVIIPIILILLCFIYFSRYAKKYDLRFRNKVVILFFLSVMCPTTLVCSINYIYYGSYIANDFKEHNFVESMKLLQSIKSVKQVNMGIIPVSEDVRSNLYSLSPSFSELKKFLDDDNAILLGWQKPSCDQFNETCGDYGGNWFFWALRDAVSLAGHYKSPETSSRFYKKLNSEIKVLCNSGQLICENKISALPSLNERQLYDIPNLISLSFKKITLINQPEIYNIPSMGSEKELSDAAKFLHLSSYYPVAASKSLIENSKITIDMQNNRNASFKIKKILHYLYSKICSWISLIGLLSFVIMMFSSKKRILHKFLLSLLWVIVGLRVILISVATEVTFALVNHQYLAFAGPVLLLAAFLSVIFLLSNLDHKHRES